MSAAIGARDDVLTRDRGRARGSYAGGSAVGAEGRGVGDVAQAVAVGIEAGGCVGLTLPQTDCGHTRADKQVVERTDAHLDVDAGNVDRADGDGRAGGLIRREMAGRTGGVAAVGVGAGRVAEGDRVGAGRDGQRVGAVSGGALTNCAVPDHERASEHVNVCQCRTCRPGDPTADPHAKGQLDIDAGHVGGGQDDRTAGARFSNEPTTRIATVDVGPTRIVEVDVVVARHDRERVGAIGRCPTPSTARRPDADVRQWLTVGSGNNAVDVQGKRHLNVDAGHVGRPYRNRGAGVPIGREAAARGAGVAAVGVGRDHAVAIEGDAVAGARQDRD